MPSPPSNLPLRAAEPPRPEDAGTPARAPRPEDAGTPARAPRPDDAGTPARSPRHPAEPPRPDDFRARRPAFEALAEALSVVGDRWTLLVIAALLDGPRRFGELQAEVDGIAPNVLSQRLRHLERHALVIARPYSERPVRLDYELSAAGRELAGPLRLLAGWGASRNPAEAAPRHLACGTPMQARWWCPVCAQILDGDDGIEPDDDVQFA